MSKTSDLHVQQQEAGFPATVTCHWPSKPVHACYHHAEHIVGLGRFMGAHIAVTVAPEGAECANCVNEAASTKGSGGL